LLSLHYEKGPNLLWHLENGLADSLDPKVWFIMIGTNDLVSKKCTEHMVLANILNVAKKLSEAHPESLFVLHGIMPRKDKPDSKSQFLGQTWKRAQNINSQIRSFCRKYRNLHYMNAGTLMLVSSKVNGRAQLDPSMIEDGLHPTLKGYETWGDYVMNKLVDVLKDFEEFKAKIKEK
jgi:lysophospholipase L1-like esterase